MDLSAALQHFRHPHLHQEMNSQADSQSLDSMIANSKPITQNNNQQQDPKKPRPPESEPQKCPRCDSTNTKFCYYNNYSLSQPRYFCKSCRRYWTKGGTLRNVPVGGGCRRNKRPSSSVSSPSSSSFSATSFLKRAHSHSNDMANPNHTQNPNPMFQSFGGLGLGFGFDHSIGNANVTEFDGFLGHPQSFLMNSIENQSLCYGLGSSSNEIPFEASGINAMKNESIENKGFWGLNYPWQVINHGDNMGLVNGVSSNADLEPVRESWNGIIGNSAWQGTLLHSSALI